MWRQGSRTAGPLRAEGWPGSQACARSCCPSSSCCLFLLELTHSPFPVSSPLPHLPGVNSERPSCRRQYLGSPLHPPPSVLYHSRRCRNRCLSPLLSWMTVSSERAQGPAEPLSRTQVLRAVLFSGSPKGVSGGHRHDSREPPCQNPPGQQLPAACRRQVHLLSPPLTLPITDPAFSGRGSSCALSHSRTVRALPARVIGFQLLRVSLPHLHIL